MNSCTYRSGAKLRRVMNAEITVVRPERTNERFATTDPVTAVLITTTVTTLARTHPVQGRILQRRILQCRILPVRSSRTHMYVRYDGVAVRTLCLLGGKWIGRARRLLFSFAANHLKNLNSLKIRIFFFFIPSLWPTLGGFATSQGIFKNTFFPDERMWERAVLIHPCSEP